MGACSKTYASTEKFSQKVSRISFASYEERLSHPDLNVVIICVSSDEHYYQAKETLEAEVCYRRKNMCLSMTDAAAVAIQFESGMVVIWRQLSVPTLTPDGFRLWY